MRGAPAADAVPSGLWDAERERPFAAGGGGVEADTQTPGKSLLYVL